MRADIVRLLSSCSRTLPGHPDKWMLGPTGKRLWVDYLDGAPGFSGRVDFIQLVGITEEEYQAIQQDIGIIHKLIDLMKQDNPELVTDMDRTESYL